MKKVVGVLTLVLLMVLISGCKKPVETDVYKDETETVVEDQVAADETETPEVVETTSENVVEESSETSTEETADTEEDGTTTVTEEVYDDTSEAIDEADVDVDPVITNVDDPAFKAEILEFLDPFYYNLFFGQGSYDEGITEGDMTKFAVSYIYQHEYNELKFDTDNFILYVPQERVDELVDKFFDVTIMSHQSFIDDNLMYEDGYYLMPAADMGWIDTMSIDTVTVTGDFSYDIRFKMSYEEETNLEPEFYIAQVELRDNRFVLVGYVKEVAVEEEESASETE